MAPRRLTAPITRQDSTAEARYYQVRGKTLETWNCCGALDDLGSGSRDREFRCLDTLI